MMGIHASLCGIVSLDVVVNVVFQLPLSSSSDVVVATVNDWKIIKEFVFGWRGKLFVLNLFFSSSSPLD
jgi:hypothetical protein